VAEDEEKEYRGSGTYDLLQGNVYNTPDEEPPALPEARRPIPPETALHRQTFDDGGYLRVRDSTGKDPDQDIPISVT